MKKTGEDGGDEKEKVNFSKAQLTVIVISVVSILVLALSIGHLMERGEPTVEKEAALEPSVVEQATELPPPAGEPSREEMTKLEENLPKQVAAPAEEKKAGPKAEQPAVAPAPAAKPPTTSAKAATPAQPSAPVIVEKSPGDHPAIKEKKPGAVKQAAPEKPKIKKATRPRHKKVKPLKKSVEVKAKKPARIAEKAETKKPAKRQVVVLTSPAPEPASKPGATPETKPKPEAKLENKPSAGSFKSEVTQPAVVPPAPVVAPSAPAIPAVDPLPNAPATPAPTPRFTLHAANFASSEDAKKLEAALNGKGYQAYILKTATPKTNWYRVMVGAYADNAEAEKAAATLSEKEKINAKILPYEKP